MLKLYHTYKKKQVPFKPVKKGKVGMYNCGPTVYDYITIGNIRTYIFEDILRRVLEYLGYKVTQVMNITDVGHLTYTDLQKEGLAKKGIELEITDTDEGLDRLEKAAKREGVSPWDIAQKYIDATFGKDYEKSNKHYEESDFGKTNILKPHHLPRATEYIKQQIDFIKILEKKGYTYKTKYAVYFDIEKFPKYEELVGQKFRDMQKGKRADTSDPDRRHPADFRLWQLNQPEHAMQWDSPWGVGYPGWHIECSVMSRELLGQPFDIHTGGEDHIKVHHPSEMAQSESAYGKPMANYWLHGAFMTVEGKRMGKSLGNAYTLEDIIKKGFDPMDLRYFYLQSHYRTKTDFTWENLESARKARRKLYRKVGQLFWDNKNVRPMPFTQMDRNNVLTLDNKKMMNISVLKKKWNKKFIQAIEDDLNIPSGLEVLWQLQSSDEEPSRKLRTILEFDRVLGLDLNNITRKIRFCLVRNGKIVSPNEDPLWIKREEARDKKDFGTADTLREDLEKKYGIKIEDTTGATIWYPQ